MGVLGINLLCQRWLLILFTPFKRAGTCARQAANEVDKNSVQLEIHWSSKVILCFDFTQHNNKNTK